ncbi:MAG: prepilin-type N-terminal cleavage/methylation domain-containing protein [Deltaproteobacteria bacterium]|nr:prepilin-type N-terminal cleavage/methylation domain-containing protein [Deltaproteobacteria bacterium]
MKKKRQKRNNDGFTMTEVIVAIMLLTVGLLAASSTMVAVFHSRTFSKTLLTATNLAQKHLEDLKSLDYPQIASTTEAYGDIQDNIKFQRVTTVTANADDTLKTVVVEVSAPNGQSVTLETLVSKR